ncbi:MAG TPA: J domain-containing protein [Pseudomonadota bacterium]|jgi:hypothetical protein|nr:J domain-containing protein [Pseudomonadota bacterium]
MHDWPWSELDIAPTADRAEIKRAYAAKLKALDRERDVEGFQALRAAYDCALREPEPRQVDSSDESSLTDARFENIESPDLRAMEVADVPECDGADRPSANVAEQSTRRSNLAFDVSYPEVEQAVRSLSEVLLRCTSGEEAERVLAKFTLLESIEFAPWISQALARELSGNDTVRWTVVQAVSKRLEWDDLYLNRRLPPDLARSLATWLMRRQMEAGKVRDASDQPAWRAVDELRHVLRPPLGFGRALQFGLELRRRLDDELAQFKQHFGDEWATAIDPGASEFMDAFSGRRFQLAIWAGRLLGRAIMLGVLGGAAALILLDMFLKFENFRFWSVLTAGVTALTVALAEVALEVRIRKRQLARTGHPRYLDQIVAACTVALMLSIVMTQMGGMQ